MKPDWDDQFTETESEQAERWAETKKDAAHRVSAGNAQNSLPPVIAKK